MRVGKAKAPGRSPRLFSTGCEVQANDGDAQVEGTRHGVIDNERAAETFLRFHVAAHVSKHEAEITDASG